MKGQVKDGHWLEPWLLTLLLFLAPGENRALAAAPSPALPTACTRLPATEVFITRQRTLERLYQRDFPRFQSDLLDFVTRWNNLGVTVIRFEPEAKAVFRGSILSESPRCLRALVEKQGVRSIVNLYSGNLVPEDELMGRELQAFRQLGGKEYLHSLNLTDRPGIDHSEASIHTRLAEIARTIERLPGNLFIHCVGGIHRTGELMGVLQKCYNHWPMERIEAEYLRHAGGQIENNPEYRPGNIALIRNFDCARIRP